MRWLRRQGHLFGQVRAVLIRVAVDVEKSTRHRQEKADVYVGEAVIS